MKRFLILWLFALPCFGQIHYVTATGGATDGTASTVETAWSWAYALFDTTNAAQGTGDTLLLLPGSVSFNTRLGDSRFIHLRGASLASPLVIMGSWTGPYLTSHITCTDSTNNLIDIHGQFVTFLALDFNMMFVPASDAYGASVVSIGANDSIPVRGIKILHCTVRNAMVTGIADNSEAVGARYEWNAIYYNGRKETNSNFGYAFYTQTQPGFGYKYYLDNLLINQWGRTAQSYTTSGRAVDSLIHRYNIAIQYPNTDDANCQWIFEESSDNQTMNAITYSNNWMWSEALEGAEAWQTVLRENAATASARIDSNWFMGGKTHFNDLSTGRTFRYNKMWCWPPPTVEGGNWDTSGVTDGTTVAGNTYATGTTTMPAWAETVIVRMSPYKSGYGHVMVFNANAGATQAWDPSSILTSGDSLYLIDAENPYAAPVYSGVWTSGTVPIPMVDTNGAVETPVSIPDTPTDKNPFTHTDSRVGAYILWVPNYAGEPEVPASSGRGTRFLRMPQNH